MGVLETEVVDDGGKRDGRGRRITTTQRRTEALRDYRASGLTMAAFARREGLKYATFAGWVARSGRRPRRTKAPRFAEVRLGPAMLPAPAVPLEVRLADGTLVRGTASEVAALMRALRE
jgi:transposase-like protein